VIVLADTHALVWWLMDPPRLSSVAHDQLRAAHDDTAGGILVSVASRIDLHYLAAKGTH
jgi:PIN domain nuclease of toxin-antitoxin system